MRTLLVTTGAAAMLLSTALSTGCFGPECTHLTDCGPGDVCTVDGTCEAHATNAALIAGGRGSAGSAPAPLPPGDGVTQPSGDFVDLHHGTIDGDIGPVPRFAGEAYGSAYTDSARSVYSLTAQNDRGDGLVMLSLIGTLRDLPSGPTPIGLADSSTSMEHNYVQLCSNTSSGQHFDGIAQDATVTVTPRDDGGTDVDIVATITHGFDATMDFGAPTVTRSHFAVE
jgi:hypothetical protein